LVPDLVVPVGEREYQFFRRERLPEVLAQYGVRPLSDATIRDEFLKFIEDGDMSASYKPVLLLGMLDRADTAGRVRVLDLVTYFRDFYADRQKNGLVVESRNVKMARVSDMSDVEIERTMLAMPFEKFERKSFFRRLKDLAYVRFAEPLWRKLSEDDKAGIRRMAGDQLVQYYERIALRSGQTRT
jgi:hypothetical protein